MSGLNRMGVTVPSRAHTPNVHAVARIMLSRAQTLTVGPGGSVDIVKSRRHQRCPGGVRCSNEK